MCDRYGGAAAWDAHCDREDREREEVLKNATCEDCAHFHMFSSGIPDAAYAFDTMLDDLGIPTCQRTSRARSRILAACPTFVCDADGVEEITPGEPPNGLACDLFELR